MANLNEIKETLKDMFRAAIKNAKDGDDENGRWVTIKGTHVFIPDGKQVEDVMREKGWLSDGKEQAEDDLVQLDVADKPTEEAQKALDEDREAREKRAEERRQEYEKSKDIDLNKLKLDNPSKGKDQPDTEKKGKGEGKKEKKNKKTGEVAKVRANINWGRNINDINEIESALKNTEFKGSEIIKTLNKFQSKTLTRDWKVVKEDKSGIELEGVEPFGNKTKFKISAYKTPDLIKQIPQQKDLSNRKINEVADIRYSNNLKSRFSDSSEDEVKETLNKINFAPTEIIKTLNKLSSGYQKKLVSDPTWKLKSETERGLTFVNDENNEFIIERKFSTDPEMNELYNWGLPSSNRVQGLAGKGNKPPLAEKYTSQVDFDKAMQYWLNTEMPSKDSVEYKTKSQLRKQYLKELDELSGRKDYAKYYEGADKKVKNGLSEIIENCKPETEQDIRILKGLADILEKEKE